MDILEFIVKVQQIAKVGLLYSKDPYALENYEALEQLSREFLNDGVVTPMIEKNLFERNIYPTPNSSVRVIVLNEKQEVLMVKEAQDDGWAVPGGWCEIYMGMKDNAIKEVKEESGVDIELGRLLAIFRREIYKNYPSIVSEYVHYFVGRPLTKNLIHNHETLDVGYFPLDQLPSLSRKNSSAELRLAFDVLLHDLDVYVD